MCGIAGHFGETKIEKKNLFSVIKTLSHRGPDANGVFTKNLKNKTISLVHTRLRILDLSMRANQPFLFCNSTLVFNGEIYNYIELKQELEKLGHNFITSSDTEVLIHSLKEWGVEKALNKFEGMWAFAWYDESNSTLVLARDRFGEKPLYVLEENNNLFFSSEIKGIAALKNEWPEKNFDHLIKYLSQGYKSLHKNNETFFKKIYEFPRGKFTIYNYDGSSITKSYWRFSSEKKNNYSAEENAENVKSLLINSLRLRTRSDVPLAFCLSSGIDSNALIHLSKKYLNLNVQGFSINSKDRRYSEKNLLKKSLINQGINCDFLETSRINFVENLKNLIQKHDSPISTISYYIQWFLLKKMRDKGYKVSISGTGADELFTGYYDHHNLYLAEIFKYKKKFFNSLKLWKKYQKNFVRNKYLKDPKLFIKQPNFREYIFQDKKNFKNFFLTKSINKFVEKKFTKSILRNRLLNELFFESVPVILHEDDHNAMSLSMENRSPFLDRKLFEYSLQIPSEQLIENGYGKSILRKALIDVVPNSILCQRKKIGFNASILEMINFKKKENKDFILDNSPIFDIISKKNIYSLIKKDKFSNSESKFLFNFINTKIFLEKKV